MCGIGFILTAKPSETAQLRREVAHELAMLNLFRGSDATGIYAASLDGAVAEMYKRAMPSPDFMQLQQSRKILDGLYDKHVLLIHTRSATVGDRGNAGAHPHQHGPITLIHNGHVPMHHSLPYPVGYNPVSDSDAIAAAMESAGVEATLAKLNGAYALVWHNTKDKLVHVITNAERPLHFIEIPDKQTIVASSEYDAVNFIANRRGWITKKNEIMYYPGPNKKGKGTLFSYGATAPNEAVTKNIDLYKEPPAKPRPSMASVMRDRRPNYEGPPNQGKADREQAVMMEMGEYGFIENDKVLILPVGWQQYMGTDETNRSGKLSVIMIPRNWKELNEKGGLHPMHAFTHGVSEDFANSIIADGSLIEGKYRGCHVTWGPGSTRKEFFEKGFALIQAQIVGLTNSHRIKIKDALGAQIRLLARSPGAYSDICFAAATGKGAPTHVNCNPRVVPKEIAKMTPVEFMAMQKAAGVVVSSVYPPGSPLAAPACSIDVSPPHGEQGDLEFQVEEAEEQDEDVPLWPGPDGKKLSTTAMRRLCSDGCAYCADALDPVDFPYVKWHGTWPVCGSCVDANLGKDSDIPGMSDLPGMDDDGPHYKGGDE